MKIGDSIIALCICIVLCAALLGLVFIILGTIDVYFKTNIATRSNVICISALVAIIVSYFAYKRME